MKVTLKTIAIGIACSALVAAATYARWGVVNAFGKKIGNELTRSSTPQATAPIQITNRTPSLEIVRYSSDKSFVTLWVKNKSSDSVTAIAIYSGRNSTVLDLGNFDNKIVRGQEEAMYISLEDINAPLIVIGAVVFESGRTEGERRFIDKMLNLRIGRKQMAEQISQFFENNSRSDVPASTKTARIKNSIELLQLEEDISKPADIFFGMHGMRDEILKELEEIEANMKIEEKQELVNINLERLEAKIKKTAKNTKLQNKEGKQ